MKWNSLVFHLITIRLAPLLLLLRLFLIVFLITHFHARASRNRDSYIYVDVPPNGDCPNPRRGYKEMSENVEYLLVRSSKALTIRMGPRNATWKVDSATIVSKANCTLSGNSIMRFDCFVNWRDLHFDYSIVKPEEPEAILQLSKAYSIFDLDAMLTVEVGSNGTIGISRVTFIHSEVTATHHLVTQNEDHVRSILLFGLRASILRSTCSINLRNYILSSISDR